MSDTAARQNLVECKNVDLHFGPVHVLHDVSVTVPAGRVIALVGESGSGKSTLAKAIVGMNKISGGSIHTTGFDMDHLSRADRHALYRTVQYIPQDPYSSLNPRRTIAQTLAEAHDPKNTSVAKSRDAMAQTLALMELGPDTLDRYPHEFSGGQRQRIAIARALLVSPDLYVADEITSALDVSVQAGVIKLLAELRAKLDYSMLFITHNLAVAQAVCDDVVVMQGGHIEEAGPISEVFAAPQSEYTQQLLDSVPGGPGFSLELTA
ncbi:ATP-binding cassette domain-containing protein [Brevibacterium sp. 50QC2O2]|uniref:ABC transporter ATP-binding protein n=1 Tax=Brevibacterium sp. 50QC2O2 TaxID=2968459 RepID=UPI00211C8813|nr:ATP-binding cassette domain-containing protein [Brevibacterium sp. 50QC2O2]MCQ9388149.1 ATP-binding cassette domain-containing protein [Brevibacterium sp. 50QC2O2]